MNTKQKEYQKYAFKVHEYMRCQIIKTTKKLKMDIETAERVYKAFYTWFQNQLHIIAEDSDNIALNLQTFIDTMTTIFDYEKWITRHLKHEGQKR